MRAVEECKAEICKLKLQQPVVRYEVVFQGRGGYNGQQNRGTLNSNAPSFHSTAQLPSFRYTQPPMQRGCFICNAWTILRENACIIRLLHLNSNKWETEKAGEPPTRPPASHRTGNK